MAIWVPLSDPQLFAPYVPGTVDEIHSPTTNSAAPSAEQQAPISHHTRIGRSYRQAAAVEGPWPSGSRMRWWVTLDWGICGERRHSGRRSPRLGYFPPPAARCTADLIALVITLPMP